MRRLPALLLLILLPSSVSATPILITAGSASWFPDGPTSLEGEGFRFSIPFTAYIFDYGPRHCRIAGCLPGALDIGFAASTLGSGSLTYGGETYRTGPASTGGQGIVPFAYGGSIVLPDVTDRDLTIVVPVTFQGSATFPGSEGFVPLLLAEGMIAQAALTFTPSDRSGVPAWRVTEARYSIGPTAVQTSQLQSVPDAGSTAGLLVLGLLALSRVRARRSAR